MSYLLGLAWALPELLAPAPLSAASEMRTVLAKIKFICSEFGVKMMFYPWHYTLAAINLGLGSRASNEGSRKLHNHGEGP